jgi:D-methionine transport system substrate-binding protein
MKKFILVLLVVFTVFGISACTNRASIDDTTITVGATPVPHAEILAIVEAILAEQGYTLEIIEFTDYVLPNTALSDSELDANFFQHQPYLTDFNANHDTNLVSAAAIHFEPFGIYQGTETDLIGLPSGTKVAIPNDQTNRARALLLLAEQGLITLPANAGLSITTADILTNPFNLEIIELEAAGIPARLADVGLAIINGNYAIGAGVTQRLIVSESPNSLAASTYANILVVREGTESKPAILALIAALQSEAVRSFILSEYPGAVYPVF